MLIKNDDRLTIDGVLAFDAFLSKGDAAGFDELLRALREHPRSRGSLPFAESTDQAFRFFNHRGEETDALSRGDMKRLFEGGVRLSLFAPLVDACADPKKLDEFLVSAAHHHMAFDPRLLIFGYGGGRRVVAVEGRSARKYSRSLDEVVKFLESHPEAASLYGDIEMRTGFRESIKSAGDLRRFMALDPEEGVDWVLDVLSLTTGYMFGSFPDAIKNQEAFIMQINEKSRATVDFHLYPSSDKEPHQPRDAQAPGRLQKALESIIAFAEKMGVRREAGGFSQALSILTSQTPAPPTRLWTLSGRRPDLYRLNSAALAADQFAGMGSWNDVQISQDETFNRVSNEVVLRILESICASAAVAP